MEIFWYRTDIVGFLTIVIRDSWKRQWRQKWIIQTLNLNVKNRNEKLQQVNE